MGQEKSFENKHASALFCFLPAVSNFVATSTLFESDLVWLSVLLGFAIAVINACALYRSEKKPSCLTRGALVFVEVCGIFCIGYDSIQYLHPRTKASLPEPFNHYGVQDKARMGISLLSLTLFFSLIMIYLESLQDNRNDGDKNEKCVIGAKGLITGGMVFVGTYPLMINFFIGLNNNVCTGWLIFGAVLFSLFSCIGQAFIIIRHEKDEPLVNDKRRLIKQNILEWIGKFFMSIEIILSLANTTFSTHGSSVDECLDLLQSKWVNKNSHIIGAVLFSLAILMFLFVSYKHAKPLYDVCRTEPVVKKRGSSVC